MRKLAKKDLHLMGSAGSLESLQKLMLDKLYWSKADLTESIRFQSRIGECYDVANGNGLVDDIVVIKSRRCSLYRIIDD